MPPQEPYIQAVQDVIGAQLGHTALPKRFLIPMREMWDMQERLTHRHRAPKLIEQGRFRAAYDFLLLREASGEHLDGLGNWWTHYQAADEAEREQMVAEAQRQKPKGKSRRKRSGRSRKKTSDTGSSE
jgi:poly(A) polymerase